MIHVRLTLYAPNTSPHYSVGINTSKATVESLKIAATHGLIIPHTNAVLVQLGDDEGQQARVRMTPEEAEDMARWLNEKAAEIRKYNKEFYE